MWGWVLAATTKVQSKVPELRALAPDDEPNIIAITEPRLTSVICKSEAVTPLFSAVKRNSSESGVGGVLPCYDSFIYSFIPKSFGF